MTITTPELNTITVEDREALTSLPVGTTLLDDTGYTFTKTGDDQWNAVTPDGEHYTEWNDYDLDFPAIVQNAEVLFSPLASKDDLTAGDRVRVITSTYDGGQHYLKTGTVVGKELYVEVALDQGPTYALLFEAGELELITDEVVAEAEEVIEPYVFQVGDRVRITAQPDGLDIDWVGVTGTVIQGGLSPRIEPDMARPDGHEFHPFWFSNGTFELIEEPRGLKVGDKVRCIDSPRLNVKEFIGIVGEVVAEGGDYNGPKVKPDTDRPDGYGREPFYLLPETWELVAPQSLYDAALDTLTDEAGDLLVTQGQIITDPFDLDPLPIGTVVRSTDGMYLAVKGVDETWLNPASKDATNFLWTALAGLGAATVGVEVLYTPIAA